MTKLGAMPTKVRWLRRFAALSAASILLALPVGNAAYAQAAAAPACSKLDVVKLQEFVGLVYNLTYWVGVDQGIFKKHCLEPVLVRFPSGPTALAGSIQGAVNFILASPENLYIASSKGFNGKFVAFMNSSVHYALVVRKGLPMPNMAEGYPGYMKDLEGKTIGVNVLGSTADAFARFDFTAAGIDPGKQTWVAYGQPQAGIAALQNGSLDAAIFFADGMDIAAAIAGGTIIADFRDLDVLKKSPLLYPMRGVHLAWAANTAFLDAHPDETRRFFLANNEALNWAADPKNFDTVVRLVGAKSPLPAGVPDPEKVLRARVQRYLATTSPRFSLSGLKGWSAFDVALKRIPAPADVEGLIWPPTREAMIP